MDTVDKIDFYDSLNSEGCAFDLSLASAADNGYSGAIPGASRGERERARVRVPSN